VTVRSVTARTSVQTRSKRRIISIEVREVVK